jgi:aspartate 1-decarboxylase
MWKTMCKSKIHRAKVTDANLNYNGSITIDKQLIEAAQLSVYEQVHIVNINNGARFETYVIEGEANSGMICLNGAAARLVAPGDLVIIISYGLYPEAETKNFQPRFIFVDEFNRIVQRP